MPQLYILTVPKLSIFIIPLTSEVATILAYDVMVYIADKNNITETIEMNISDRITGTETVTNVDTSINGAKASYSISNGALTISQYTSNDFTLEYVYKLTGDTSTVVLDAADQVTINVTTADGNYTFIINNKTATTASEDITTVAAS